MVLYTQTHPFNGPLSRTTWVSRYQKGKTNLDFTKARDRMPFLPFSQQLFGAIQVCYLLLDLYSVVLVVKV